MEGVSAELQEAYFSTIKELKEGDIVKGKVISVTSQGVIVDVGYKSEGIIPRDEFKEVEDPCQLGEIDVFVENVEDEEGRIILSYSRAREAKGWQNLLEKNNEGDMIEGTVTRL